MSTFKCPFCRLKYKTKPSLYSHMETTHESDLYHMPAAQVYYNFRTRRPLSTGFGKCRVSGKQTKFNTTTERYEPFYSKREVKIFREMFLERMRNKLGVESLLNDPEHQKKMLANRSISGEYTWRDGVSKTGYTGKLEESFLIFLDTQLNWDDPNDIIAPAPQVFNYVGTDGKNHFHFPDFYVSSLNLIINVKSSENNHYRKRDLETELIEDKIIKEDGRFNYMKILDRDYREFMRFLENSTKN